MNRNKSLLAPVSSRRLSSKAAALRKPQTAVRSRPRQRLQGSPEAQALDETPYVALVPLAKNIVWPPLGSGDRTGEPENMGR